MQIGTSIQQVMACMKKGRVSETYIFLNLYFSFPASRENIDHNLLYKITSTHNEKVPDFFKKIEEFADDSAMIRLLKL